MVNERQTDTCADVMYRRERQRGCGEAGLDFVPFIPSQDEVDQQMSALDDKLVAKAQEQYANREIYPLDECYQLDGSTFRVKGQNVCLARRVAGVRFGLFECRLSGCSRCR